MLVAIGPLAGEGKLGAFVSDGPGADWSYDATLGMATSQSYELAKVAKPHPLRADLPVAVLTGPLTAGAGEALVVAFAGRAKDVIKHGGYSVYALEVEEAMAAHPAVAEVAVLGLPDPAKGELPVAAVRLEAGASATPEELVAFGKEHLSDYKWPRQVVLVDELPRTGSQKVQKRELLALFTSPA